jgi:hypothetical protein
MKKLSTMLLAVVFAVALAACSDDNGGNGDDAPVDSPVATEVVDG